jgi:hypothetical protein
MKKGSRLHVQDWKDRKDAHVPLYIRQVHKLAPWCISINEIAPYDMLLV